MRFTVMQLNAHRASSWAVLLASTGEVVEHDDRLLLGLTKKLAEEWRDRLEDGPPTTSEIKRKWSRLRL